MVTLQHLCGEALSLAFPFTSSHVPSTTKKTIKQIFSQLSANGIVPLNVLPLQVTVRALQCTLQDQRHYFRWLGNTTHLDLTGRYIHKFTLESLG
jgi:hypothetical protein